MSLYECARQRESVVLPHAASVTRGVLAADHLDDLPHYTDVAQGVADHAALDTETDRAFLEHILRDVRIGANSETQGKRLTIRDFFDFLGHDDNLTQFSNMLEGLSTQDAVASADQINLIAKRLLQLHSICEIAREKALQSHQLYTHADIHTVHNHLSEKLMQIYEQVRARVTLRFRHHLPAFQEGAQHFGLVEHQQNVALPEGVPATQVGVVSPLYLAGMLAKPNSQPHLRLVVDNSQAAA